MYSATPDKIVYAICGFTFTVPSIFFAYYTVRLMYLFAATDLIEHRSNGMLIGAIAFPLAAIIFGFISWYFINKARRCPGQNRER